MDKVLMSGVFGATAGAAGFVIAKKIHGQDKADRCYPLYALALFGLFHSVFYLFKGSSL